MSALIFALALCTPAQAPAAEPAAPSAPVDAAAPVAEPVPAAEPVVDPTPGSAPAAAPEAEDSGFVTVVDLITIGPGDHLWTSFGHTAISVMRMNPQTREYESTVYNWGDADFGGWAFMWSFFTGDAVFMLSNMGTIEDVVNQYATLNRTLIQQRFALTQEQAELVAQRLELHVQPENRDYVYHHLNATCGTKVRDFFDEEVVGGVIKGQLSDLEDPMSPRYYGRKFFAGFFFAELFNDLFMGRLHDNRWSKFDSMTVPDNLSAYLRSVKVYDAKGGGELVPLLSAPTPIVRDVPDKPYRGEGRSLIHVAYILLVVIIAMGLYTLRRRQVVLEDAGFWVFLGVLPSLAIAGCMIFGAIMSSVAEGQINELHLVYPVTDVVLLPVALQWWRGKAFLPNWLWIYAWVRVGGILLSLLLHALGLFYQEPRIMVVAGLIVLSMFVVVLYRMRRDQANPMLASLGSARSEAGR